MTRAVLVDGLVKRYRPQAPAAVDDLSFTVDEGEVFGLLGPNGAGKSTTVGVLITRVLPTAGRCAIFGVDVVDRPAAVRQMLAAVPQRNTLDRTLTVRQNLLFHARYHGVGRAERGRRADELLERMGLTPQATQRPDRLSGGQAQRVVIARALMHRPRILFLDEPSTGLDVQSRLFIHDKIRELRSEGVTIVLTTHDMDEAEDLADRVGIVDHGRLLALDSPSALKRALPGGTVITVTAQRGRTAPAEILASLRTVRGVASAEHATESGAAGPSDQYRVHTGGEPPTLLPQLARVLADQSCELVDLSFNRPSLQDVFVSLTGKEQR